MRERGGVWIAHGSGDADREVVDEGDRLSVPPDSPSYTLRRLWLTDEEARQYYEGFANEGLWPLCHEAHVRPIFRNPDWESYQRVNARFAEVVESELPDLSAPVFIQDYHLALVAANLRRRQPGVKTAIFWHIPWPSPDRLRICPWRRRSADRPPRQRPHRVPARSRPPQLPDRGAGRISTSRRRATRCAWAPDRGGQGGPIGVDYDRIQQIAGDPTLEAETAKLRHELGLDTPLIGIGVDRLDYTKGVLERLDALELLLERRPDLRDRLTFVQIGVPSRSSLRSYIDVVQAIDRKVADINGPVRLGTRGDPVSQVGLSDQAPRGPVPPRALLHRQLAARRHEPGGEGVRRRAREDADGVLVLSEMAGAAQQLNDALIINPYDVEGFTTAIEQAIDMQPDERRRRMRAMRRIVAGRNIFRWASGHPRGPRGA